MGDEGKGKMTDVLAAQSSYVVRFQGGSNAGHTIINDFGKFSLHMLPSGVFYPNVTNIIGPGTALDMEILTKELQELKARNVPEPQLKISERAQVVLPIHRLLDELEEERWAPRVLVPQDAALRRSMRTNMPSLGYKLQICSILTDYVNDSSN
ncbi:adenylosuccinate synthetase [Paenibacillus sp. JCM 10914]|nr:adenylosuccinate synthetase [Paenibacillus sp. JCM 10914]